jgi:uncharacterized protein YdiU (UPF0061 family)
MTISGETIDYGPCAFMDVYDPATVFSSIDHGGRYAYGRQPLIAQWNLARLGESLLPLIDDDTDTAVAAATEALMSFTDRFSEHWRAGMRAKLGLAEAADGEQQLFDELLTTMAACKADYSSVVRALAGDLAGGAGALASVVDDAASFGPWIDRWRARLATEGRDPAVVAETMNAVNPVYIPRNHLVEEALDAATGGDLEAFDRLVRVVRDPYAPRPGFERFAEPAPQSFGRYYQTFCGT